MGLVVACVRASLRAVLNSRGITVHVIATKSSDGGVGAAVGATSAAVADAVAAAAAARAAAAVSEGSAAPGQQLFVLEVDEEKEEKVGLQQQDHHQHHHNLQQQDEQQQPQQQQQQQQQQGWWVASLGLRRHGRRAAASDPTTTGGRRQQQQQGREFGTEGSGGFDGGGGAFSATSGGGGGGGGGGGEEPGRERTFFHTLWFMLADVVAVARGPERRAFGLAAGLAFFDQVGGVKGRRACSVERMVELADSTNQQPQSQPSETNHQATASTAIINYCPVLLEERFGLPPARATLLPAAVALTKCAGVAAALLLVDRAGRRPLLIGGGAVTAVALAAAAAAAAGGSVGWFLAALCLFIFAFSVSWAGLYWVVVSELFSMVSPGRSHGFVAVGVWSRIVSCPLARAHTQTTFPPPPTQPGRQVAGH
jgi:hypothetical protein